MVIDITGKKFGRLTVIERSENNKYGDAMWLCRCDCGAFRKTVGSALRNGHTQSCGCLHKEKVANMNTVHNESNTPLYKRWHAIKQRCENPSNPSYKDYGGRGIKICDEWLTYEGFKEWALNNGYKKSLTIERLDVNGDYTPSNCIFASRAVQNRNTRRTIRLCVKGEMKTISEIARELGIPKWRALEDYHSLRRRDFMKKYHLDGGVEIDKTLAKIYGLKG